MAKKQSFSQKSKKVKYIEKCKACSGDITPTLLCVAVKSERGYRYNKRLVKICICKSLDFWTEQMEQK